MCILPLAPPHQEAIFIILPLQCNVVAPKWLQVTHLHATSTYDFLTVFMRSESWFVRVCLEQRRTYFILQDILRAVSSGDLQLWCCSTCTMDNMQPMV